MKNPNNTEFSTPGLKGVMQFLYDVSGPAAAGTKQYQVLTATLVNLASLHPVDSKPIYSLLSVKRTTTERTTAKAAPANWLAGNTSSAAGASVSSSSKPDCPFCDEKEKAKAATTPQEVTTASKEPALPPEILQAPPAEPEQFNPEGKRMREADTVEKMLVYHGEGKVSNRELKEKLIASCIMVEPQHPDGTFDRRWSHKKLAAYIVNSMKLEQ